LLEYSVYTQETWFWSN